ERGGRGLVSADFHAVDVIAHVVGVVDGPGREPQHLFLELVQDRKLARAGLRRGAFGHADESTAVCGWAKSARPPLTPCHAREGRHTANRECATKPRRTSHPLQRLLDCPLSRRVTAGRPLKNGGAI